MNHADAESIAAPTFRAVIEKDISTPASITAISRISPPPYFHTRYQNIATSVVPGLSPRYR